MTNHITIELSEPDRAALDKIYAKLDEIAARLEGKAAPAPRKAAAPKVAPAEEKKAADKPELPETPPPAAEAKADKPQPTVTQDDVRSKYMKLSRVSTEMKEAARDIIKAYGDTISAITDPLQLAEAYRKLVALEG